MFCYAFKGEFAMPRGEGRMAFNRRGDHTERFNGEQLSGRDFGLQPSYPAPT